MKRSKRVPFTEMENCLIRQFADLYGKNWEAIAKRLPGRTPKQIHDRYINYLQDGLKKEPWTPKEDEILIQEFNKIGPKWSKMVDKLPGRSGNDIKNRWHKHLYKKTFDLTGNEKTTNFDELFVDQFSFQNKNRNETLNKYHYNFVSNPNINCCANNPNTYYMKNTSFLIPNVAKERNLMFNQQYFQMQMQPLNFANNQKKELISKRKNSTKKDKKTTEQQNSFIKVINKFEINDNSKKQFEENDFVEDNINSLNNLAIQEIEEDIKSSKLDYSWI